MNAEIYEIKVELQSKQVELKRLARLMRSAAMAARLRGEDPSPTQCAGLAMSLWLSVTGEPGHRLLSDGRQSRLDLKIGYPILDDLAQVDISIEACQREFASAELVA